MTDPVGQTDLILKGKVTEQGVGVSGYVWMFITVTVQKSSTLTIPMKTESGHMERRKLEIGTGSDIQMRDINLKK